MRICIFCGSGDGTDARYRRAASALGEALAKEKLGVVYGGAKVGLMGAVADAALAHGGEVIGIMPHALADKEIAHRGLTDLRIVKTMHERKELMSDLADGGCIALPGGLGTLEELFEMWTWGQLGYHIKPVSLLNVGRFYDGLIQFLNGVVEGGFVRKDHRDMLIVEEEPTRLIERILTYTPPPSPKWAGKDER